MRFTHLVPTALTSAAPEKERGDAHGQRHTDDDSLGFPLAHAQYYMLLELLV